MAAARTVSLDHHWRIIHDDDESGATRSWTRMVPDEARPAPVPGVAQMVFPHRHGVFWYFARIPSLPDLGRGLVLELDGADYSAEVWVDGQRIGDHRGAEEAFALPLPANTQVGSLVVVRVVNPTESGSGGIRLREIPSRNKAAEEFTIGRSMNHGGLTARTRIRGLPHVEISDLDVRSTLEGVLTVKIACASRLELPMASVVALVVRDREQLHHLEEIEMVLAPGSTSVDVEVHLGEPRLWSPQDPHLYTIEASVRLDGRTQHAGSVRHGIRELRLVDGYFHLNGCPIFILGAHTGNHVPWGQQVGVLDDHLRRDLVLAKAAGLTMVRFIAGIATPEQLDMCDELGLLVYEECYAAWELGDSDEALQSFDDATLAMVRRDRHHASVVIWGLLNETRRGAVFDRAVALLPVLREVDDTRIVLLGSGRWDQRPSIGSAANPGSREWENTWAGDGEPDLPEDASLAMGFAEKAGDLHIYPEAPHHPETLERLRTLGVGSGPVLISEHGIGSALDAIAAARGFRRRGIPQSQDGELYARIERQFLQDWERYDLGSVLADPETFFEISLAQNARRRYPGTIAIRSNPMVAGYSLSGLVDQGFSGEGLWTTWRDLKPGMLEMLSSVAAPEQVGILVRRPEVLPGGDPGIHLSLVHEAGPRSPWQVHVEVRGPGGFRHLRHEEVEVGTRAPFVTDLGPLGLPPLHDPGEYRITVRVDGDLLPGSRGTFHVAALPRPRDPAPVTLRGRTTPAADALERMGVRVAPESMTSVDLVDAGDEEAVSQLDRWLAAGRTVVLSGVSTSLEVDGTPLAATRRTTFLYNREEIVLDHPLVRGFLEPGVTDWERHAPLMDHTFMEPGGDDEAVVVVVYPGYSSREGYHSGASLLTRRVGAGRLVASTGDLLGGAVSGAPAALRVLAACVENLSRMPAGLT